MSATPGPPPGDVRMKGPAFIIEFDHRSDDGPRHVGPFPSRSAATRWVDRQKFKTAEWSVIKLWIPESDPSESGERPRP